MLSDSFSIDRLCMENRKRVELLAPAGSPKAFYGAVSAGADAVYLGGAKFGARAYAENFTEEELVACIRYGRLFGVKAYLTVNTLFKEQELEELSAFLAPLCEAGLKGVIVQDIGVLARIRDDFPSLEIHASTQMTLCSAYGADFLKAMGVSRIVPARELSLEELTEIKRRTGLELETFIHGAMCYCYSGQCLFSSILGGRSGNRGRCAQPCRLPYRMKNGTMASPCYPLSLKDMYTIDHIPALVEAGIDSFKIEGRMKKPEYAAGVTAIYRKYIDHYYKLQESYGPEKASEEFQISRDDRENLSTLYVRSQLQDGYYFKRNGREMITLSNPAYSGTDEELLERIRRDYLQDRPRLKVEVEARFLTGKSAKVILRRGEAVGEAIGATVQAANNQPVTEENIRRQLGKLGESPFEASEMRLQISRDAFCPLKEINELRRQAVQALETDLRKEDGQYSDSDAGKKERKCLIDLKEGRRPNWSTCNVLNRPKQSIDILGGENSLETSGVSELSHTSQPGWTISVRTMDQLKALEGITDGFDLRRLYLDGDLLLREIKECLTVCDRLRKQKHYRDDSASLDRLKLFASLPYILRETDVPQLEELWDLAGQEVLDGFLVRSLDQLGFLLAKEQESSRRICLRTDAGVYVWNSETARQLFSLTDGFCLPYELKAPEQHRLVEKTESENGGISWEKVIYGHIPMMVTANCLQKTFDRCIDNGDGLLWLEDRFHTEFPVLRNCAHCVNIIYNSVPLALFGNRDSWKSLDALRLDFTIETGQELIRILKTCFMGKRLSQAHTTGHEKRGVE